MNNSLIIGITGDASKWEKWGSHSGCNWQNFQIIFGRRWQKYWEVWEEVEDSQVTNEDEEIRPTRKVCSPTAMSITILMRECSQL